MKKIVGDINDLPRINYMQVVPNSHYWTDLEQLLTYLNNTQSSGNQWYDNAWKAEVEFMVIGLENTIKNGYNIKKINEKIDDVDYLFESVENIIIFVKDVDLSGDYRANEFLADFIKSVENTITYGYNLTNGLKMERTEIYKCIDGERDYQDKTWVARRTLDGTPDEEKPVAEWINYIEFHIAKAKDKVYHLDTLGATHELRKVAALAVRAMEIHGCPMRDVGEILNPLNLDPNTYKLRDDKCCGDNCECKK